MSGTIGENEGGDSKRRDKVLWKKVKFRSYGMKKSEAVLTNRKMDPFQVLEPFFLLFFCASYTLKGTT